MDFIKKARPNAIIHPAAFTDVDQPNPINVYGRSKLWGKYTIQVPTPVAVPGMFPVLTRTGG